MYSIVDSSYKLCDRLLQFKLLQLCAVDLYGTAWFSCSINVPRGMLKVQDGIQLVKRN